MRYERRKNDVNICRETAFTRHQDDIMMTFQSMMVNQQAFFSLDFYYFIIETPYLIFGIGGDQLGLPGQLFWDGQTNKGIFFTKHI